MIVDKLENTEKYWPVSPLIKKAFEFLKETDLSALPQGRTDIEGDNLFALHQTYETGAESEKRLEAHRKYMDIQFLVKGGECMGYCSNTDLPVQTPYDPDKDIEFFKDSPVMSLLIDQGDFALFFPGEPHKPSCHHPNSKDHKVEKIVLKIKIS